MCEHSSKLVAWMDREVEPGEAAAIAQHLLTCAECRSCLAEFRRVSAEFNECCEQIVRTADPHKAVRFQPVLLAAAAILLAVTLGYSHRHVTPTVQQPNRTAIAATSPFSQATMQGAKNLPAPFQPSHHRAHRPRAVSTNKAAGSVEPCASSDCAPTNLQAPDSATEGPAIEIAIPADAMFPPGAVPEGLSFVADLSIGADGSARQVRLQREISAFERRLSQP